MLLKNQNTAVAGLERIFRLMVNASVVVGLSGYSLVRLTQFIFKIERKNVALLVFFATIAGYNFVKYDALIRLKREKIKGDLKAIAAVSFLALLASAYFFFQLHFRSWVVIGIFGLLTLLYALPFFPDKQNARNWAGTKIYMVSLCWMGMTAILPLVEAGVAFGTDFVLICLSRFLFVLVLVLIFEIIDLRFDDPLLQTIPQQMGVKRTKILGCGLLVALFILHFFISQNNSSDLWVLLVVLGVTGNFLFYAHENRSRYYTLFWAELIPVLWFVLLTAA